jgi:toluene monooxygenase system ferredoxin subunit
MADGDRALSTSDGRERVWHPTLSLDDLWEGDMEPVEVAGQKVLLVNADGEVRAYLNRCPHQAWALDDGYFDGEKIVCSNHSWEFDARSGCGINPGDCQLTSFPCMVNDEEMICVDVG